MTVMGALRKVNQRLGRPARFLGRAREAFEPRIRMRGFERDRESRLAKYRALTAQFTPRPDIASALERDGVTILGGAVDMQVLHDIRVEGEAHLNTGMSLLPVSKDSVRRKGDRGVAKVFLNADELGRGQEYFRQHTNYVAIANPLVSCPAVLKLAFHPLLSDIAYTYLQSVPAIGGLNLRKSYANEIPEFDTLHFHADPNSPKFLKFFFYLNDVNVNGGPFCYVRGSHRQRFTGWMSKGRWTQDEIERIYGKENIMYLTGSVGDVIVADTNGFHRGTKVLSTDRFMLTVDYVVHPEFYGTQDESLFQIPAAVVERFSPKDRALADFLQVV